MLKSSSIVFLACMLASAAAIGRPFRSVSDPPARGPTKDLSAMADYNTTRWYNEQSVDHFDGSSTATFKHRYFVNETFWKGDGPVFLCVGGEGPALDPDVVVTGDVHCAWMMHLAAEHHALVFAVEHRFYGYSLPTPDFTTESLRLLSSEQALSDLAQWHGYVSDLYNLDAEKNKWVTFGGSYPGMMAGWFRLKYPNLIHASVSSSSPVLAQYNFQGYNDVVAASMSNTMVGGSHKCHDAIKDAFEAVGDALSTSTGRKSLEADFGVCKGDTIESKANQAAFTGGLSGLFPVQSNDPLCTYEACNIEKICEIMTDDSDLPIARLAKLNSIMWGGQCVTVDAQEDIRALTNTTLEGGTERIWFYQTCAEFAFFQTCDPGSECIFMQKPHLNDISAFTDLCKIAFDISPEHTQMRVKASNAFYGGDQPMGTRILFVNGDIDPWHYLSVLKSLPNEPALYVKGASHHSWTHPLRAGDSKELTQVRQQIRQQVWEWLSE